MIKFRLSLENEFFLSSKKKYFLFIVLLQFSLNLFAQPVINSFTPTSGPVGTTVTINGSGFNSSAPNNIVFFGAVRATVTSASATSLSVQVPTGATYQPITVTTGGLTAFSNKPFIITFTGGGIITTASLDTKTDDTTDLRPHGMAVADFDGDGKPDIATANNYSIDGQPASISVLRNTSSIKNLSFASRQDIPNGVLTYTIAAGDLDGDGKPDIVCSSIKDQTISVLRNTSTPGAITFAPKINFPAGDNTYSIAITDLDADGKPDIVFTNYFSNSVSIYKNTSTSSGIISFSARQNLGTGLAPTSLTVTDMDGDNKQDIVVANSLSRNISIFRNNSSTGAISFFQKLDFATASNDPFGLAAGDIDLDGKPDLVITYQNLFSSVQSTVSFSVFRNTTTGGVVSFGSKGNYSSGDSYHPGIADLNGDGKPDLIIPSLDLGIVAYQNVSSSFIDFYNGQKFYAPSPYFPRMADFDGDDKTDVAVSNLTMEWISVLRNRTTEPGVVSFSPQTAATGETVTITGVNFTGVTSVSFGGVPATSFSVINSTSIKAVVGAGTSGSVSVTGPLGTSALSGFTYYFPPSISSFSPASAPTGVMVFIKGSHFRGVNAVSFGGVPAKSFTVNSDTTITAVVGAGATGSITVQNSFGTASKAGFVYLPPPVVTSFNPTSGGPGTVVTITGDYFTGATSVKFAQAPVASYTVSSATSITAVISGGSSGLLTIETPYGKVSFGNFTYIAPPAPVITSFAPASGPVGTLVTIKGNNFNPVVSNNIVYFGATRGLVTSASATEVTVQVPAGTTHQPITILNRTTFLSTLSKLPFLVTFNGAASFNSYSFAAKKDFSTGWIVGQTIAADMDNDGKPDIIYGDNGGDGIDLLKNTSTPGNVSFAPKLQCGHLFDGFWGVAVADIDGDGLLDIAATDKSYAIVPVSKLCILRNTSSSNNISFEQFDFTANLSTQGLALGDLNNDGKPDVIVANSGSNNVSVFVNTSTPGNISFAAKKDYSTGRYPNNICIVDFDGDKKLDFVVNNGFDQAISIFRNTSGDSLSFANPLTIGVATTGTTEYIAAGDLDDDGKPDLAVTNAYYTNTVALLKNTSVPGSISFAPRIDYATSNDPMHVAFQDMNGDGKLDMVIANSSYGKSISVFKNTSSNSVISFDTKVDFSYPNGNNWFYALALCDIDGDNRPDITTSNQQSTISVLRNQVDLVKEVKVCANGVADIGSDVIGTTYKWQLNTGNGFNDIFDNTNFSGTATATLHVTNIPFGWNGYLFRCKVDTGFSTVAGLTTLTGVAAYVGITATSTQICSGTNVTFTATPTNGGTAPSYQWQVNGVNVGTNSNTFSTATLINKDRVSAILTSNANCIATPTATSNIITVTVVPTSTPTVTIAVSVNNICTGTSVTFSATPTNGGTTPAFQWQVNNVNVGTNSNSFTSSALNNNDQVKVILTSNATCVSTPTATSTPIIMIVNAFTKLLGKASSPAQVCVGTSYNVSFTTSNAPHGSSVQLWENINNGTFNSGSTQTYIGATLNFTVGSNSSGSKKYFFKITPPASNNCAVSNNSDTSTTVIDQLAKPVTSITANTVTITNPDAGTTYQWQVQDANSNWININPAVTGLSYTATATGSYRTRGDKGQCTQYSDVQLVTVTNPNTNPSNETVLLYPNPTQGTLTLDSMKLSDNWEVLDIVSLQSGQTVASFNIINQTKITVHLEALTNGIYLAVLRRRNGSSISIEFVKM